MQYFPTKDPALAYKRAQTALSHARLWADVAAYWAAREGVSSRWARAHRKARSFERHAIKYMAAFCAARKT